MLYLLLLAAPTSLALSTAFPLRRLRPGDRTPPSGSYRRRLLYVRTLFVLLGGSLAGAALFATPTLAMYWLIFLWPALTVLVSRLAVESYHADRRRTRRVAAVADPLTSAATGPE